MEYLKINNLLDADSERQPIYLTRKWVEVSDESKGTYRAGSMIKYNTRTTMADLCDYSEAYILVDGTITTDAAGAARAGTFAFKNCGPFTECITKINNTQIDHSENLDLTMPMYNMLEYSENYAKTSGLLYRFSRDDGADIDVNNQSFTSKKVGQIVADAFAANTPDSINVQLRVPLKYLSNFWRVLEMPLINCEVNL